MRPSSASRMFRLFRHDERNRVVLFGEADGGAVARPEFTRQLRIDGQRQEARRRSQSIFLQDHRAIVEGGARLEVLLISRSCVTVASRGIPGLDVVSQADRTLDGDDRAESL